MSNKKMSFNQNDDNYRVVYVQSSTAGNVKNILLYALALAAALSFNDFIRSVFAKFDIYNGNVIVSKLVYVVVMFVSVLTLAYFTQSKINI